MTSLSAVKTIPGSVFFAEKEFLIHFVAIKTNSVLMPCFPLYAVPALCLKIRPMFADPNRQIQTLKELIPKDSYYRYE